MTISDNQRSAISLLAELWSLSPDVRLGQLFAHLGDLGEDYVARSLGYIEDDDLMAVMVRHREELLARLQGRLDYPHFVSPTVNLPSSPTAPVGNSNP